MVQIKKKVTLKEKREQAYVPEQVQHTPIPNGRSRNRKIIGGIITAVVACVLCYGAYLFLTPDDRNENTAIISVGGGDTKKANNGEIMEMSETKVGTSGKSTSSPAQEETPSEASSHHAESKQDIPTKPTEHSMEKNQSTKTMQSIASTVQQITLSGTLEEKAMAVIRGNYGNGEVRKQKLGDQYAEIQSKVNEMYRNGLVKQ